MNTRIVGDRWKEMRGDVQERWDKLTDEDLSRVEGKLDELIALVQDRYEYNRDKAAKEVERFLSDNKARLQETTEDVVTTAEETVVEYPWRIMLAMLLVGFVLGLLFQPGGRGDK